MIARILSSPGTLLLALAATGLVLGLSRASPSSAAGRTDGPACSTRPGPASAPADSARTDGDRLHLEVHLPGGGAPFEGTVRVPLGPATDTLRWVRGDLELEDLHILASDSARVSLLETESDTAAVVVRRFGGDRDRAARGRDSIEVRRDSLSARGDSLRAGTEPGPAAADASQDSVPRRSAPDTLVLGFRGSADEILERIRRPGAEHPTVWTPPPDARTSPWFPVPLRTDSVGGVELTLVTDTAYAVAAPGRRVYARTSETADPPRRRSRFLIGGPVALDRLGWAAGPRIVTTRGKSRTGTGATPTVEAYLPRTRSGSAAEIVEQIEALLPNLESVVGRTRPTDRLRIAAVPGLHEPGPDPPGLTLVPDSLFGAPLPPRLSSRAYPLARALADQWTAPRLPPSAPAWLRDSWAPYAALRTLEHRGDSVEATRVLRRAQARLPAARSHAAEGASPSSLAARRARGLWVWMLLDRAGPGADPSDDADQETLERALRRTGPDRPRLRLRYRPAPGGDSLLVEIERSVVGSRAPEAVPREPFRLTLEIGTVRGLRRFDVRVGAGTRTVRLPLPGGADFLVVDPRNRWPFPVRIEQNASSLLDQLRRASTLEGRIQAARALTRFRDDPALPIGIRGVLEREPPLLVEHAIVRTLGRLPGGGSRDALIRSRLTAAHPLIRTAAVTAVARSGSTGIDAAVLTKRARADENVYVQAAAVRGAARRQPEGWTSLVESAFVTDAPNEVIRRAAFDALAVGRVPPENGLEPALTWSSPDRDPLLRAAAPTYLVQVDERASARTRLEALLADPDLRVRLAAADALGRTEASYARSLVTDRLEDETHPWVRWLLEPSADSSPDGAR